MKVRGGGTRGECGGWWWGSAVLVLSLVCMLPVRAQTELESVFPNGARQGTTVELKLTGKELPETGTLYVDGEAVRYPETLNEARTFVREHRPRAGTSPRANKTVQRMEASRFA